MASVNKAECISARRVLPDGSAASISGPILRNVALSQSVISNYVTLKESATKIAAPLPKTTGASKNTVQLATAQLGNLQGLLKDFDELIPPPNKTTTQITNGYKWTFEGVAYRVIRVPGDKPGGYGLSVDGMAGMTYYLTPEANVKVTLYKKHTLTNKEATVAATAANTPCLIKVQINNDDEVTDAYTNGGVGGETGYVKVTVGDDGASTSNYVKDYDELETKIDAIFGTAAFPPPAPPAPE